jgi:hypothetical protein
MLGRVARPAAAGLALLQLALRLRVGCALRLRGGSDCLCNLKPVPSVDIDRLGWGYYLALGVTG